MQRATESMKEWLKKWMGDKNDELNFITRPAMEFLVLGTGADS